MNVYGECVSKPGGRRCQHDCVWRVSTVNLGGEGVNVRRVCKVNLGGEEGNMTVYEE